MASQARLFLIKTGVLLDLTATFLFFFGKSLFKFDIPNTFVVPDPLLIAQADPKIPIFCELLFGLARIRW
jgi:hypothetical protein